MIKSKQYGPVRQFTMGRVLDGRLLYSMACYYVDGLLIDSGPVHVASELPQAFAGYQVDTIVNTHHHEDHIGNNAWFQENKATGPALASAPTVALINSIEDGVNTLLPYRQYTWGEPLSSQAVIIGSEIKTKNYCFKVLETPGHSPGHISLLESKQGWLFTGDLYLAEKVRSINIDEDPNLMLRSLKKLLDYEFETLYCSSGRVLENAHQAIQAKINYWEEKSQNVHFLHEQGLSPEEIRDKLFGSESPLYEVSEGELGKIHLVNAFIYK
jgi:glyoxylase-like metal-dependent hydrolase (beta-lactamase superfamily II)